MLKKMKGAIFDLDGTLLDSMGVWRQIDIDFLGKRGLMVPIDYLQAITAMNFEVAADYTITRFKLPETPADIIAEWMTMAAHQYAHEVQLKPYVIEYLKQLKARDIKIAAATSSDRQLFEPCLKNNCIYEYFDAFAVTSEVKRTKGFPDVYEKAADRLALEASECVVYEDIYKGIEGAKMGGFYAVGVEDEHSHYEKDMIKRDADYYIESFLELCE